MDLRKLALLFFVAAGCTENRHGGSTGREEDAIGGFRDAGPNGLFRDSAFPPPLPPNTSPLRFTLEPVADSFVRSGDDEDKNFGREADLEVEDDDDKTHSFLKFALPPGGRITSARLKIFAKDEFEDGPTIHLVSDSSWTEDTITWRNQPSGSSIPAGILISGDEDSWIETELIGLRGLNIGMGGPASLVLLPRSEDGFEFTSRETNTPPQLILEIDQPTHAPDASVPQDAGSLPDAVIILDASAPYDAALPDAAAPPPPPANDPIFVGAGDIADCSSNGDEATAVLLDRIFSSNPNGLIFTLGDNAYPDGDPADFADCYEPGWGRHKARTRPSPGNHDYHVAGAAGYYAYFGTAAGNSGQGWYSYDLGNWHIISLNSNCGDVGGCQAGSAQERWLRADLAANPKPCTLAYWHHPRFSSGDHGDDNVTQDLWQALYEAGADVILTGHDHNYERFAKQNPQGQADPARGIRQFVIGTGGRPLRGMAGLRPNSEVRDDTSFGIFKMTLHATSYDWEMIPVAGAGFSDRGTTNCH